MLCRSTHVVGAVPNALPAMLCAGILVTRRTKIDNSRARHPQQHDRRDVRPQRALMQEIDSCATAIFVAVQAQNAATDLSRFSNCDLSFNPREEKCFAWPLCGIVD